jgi:hypothetical protein
MVPLLSASTSLIISWSSDSEGFWPKLRMTVPNSFVVICPAVRHVSQSPPYLFQHAFPQATSYLGGAKAEPLTIAIFVLTSTLADAQLGA